MREQLLQLLFYVRGAWRYRWPAMLAAWLVAIGGWIVVALLPNHYEARAKVFVDTESVLKPLLQGLAVNTDVMNQVNMMARVLMSRPNLEKVAQETDLSLRAPTPEEFQRLVEGLPQRIGLNGGAGNVFAISFQDSDPQMAYRVVKTLVDTFVESAIGVKRDDTSGAQRFLEEQKSEVEQKLRDTEDRLTEFKKHNIGLMPGETGDYYQRRQTAAEELAKLKAQFAIAEQRRDELRRQLQGEEPTFGLFTGGVSQKSGPTSPVDARIAELERAKEQLRLQYTDKHPKIRAIDETIAQLKQSKDQNAVAPPAPETDAVRLQARALDVNPVYQSIKISLSQAELEVVELRNKIGQQQEIVTDLQAKVNTIPEIEAELVRLNRDYDNNRQQYQLLSQRVETARLSEQAEGAREQIKFRVIDPPTIPLVPLSPNRYILASAVFVFALGAGAGLALLLNLLNPVFSDRNTLSTVTGVPVLGVVALSRSRAATVNGHPIQWLGGIMALAVIFLIVLAMASKMAAALTAVVR